MKVHRRNNSTSNIVALPELEAKEEDVSNHNFLTRYITYLETTFKLSRHNRYKQWLLTLGTIMVLISIIFLATMAANSFVFGSPFRFEETINENEQVFQRRQDVATTLNDKCQNTEQGRDYITDNNGYICKRKDVDPMSRCCKISEQPASTDAATPSETTQPISKRFSCERCNATTYCCSVYEQCVSCCMDPRKESLRKQVLKADSTFAASFFSSGPNNEGNVFEYCKAVCRTSSKSIFAINKYRNDEKHCYGVYGPPIQDTELLSLMGSSDYQTQLTNVPQNPPLDEIDEGLKKGQYFNNHDSANNNNNNKNNHSPSTGGFRENSPNLNGDVPSSDNADNEDNFVHSPPSYDMDDEDQMNPNLKGGNGQIPQEFGGQFPSFRVGYKVSASSVLDVANVLRISLLICLVVAIFWHQ